MGNIRFVAMTWPYLITCGSKVAVALLFNQYMPPEMQHKDLRGFLTSPTMAQGLAQTMFWLGILGITNAASLSRAMSSSMRKLALIDNACKPKTTIHVNSSGQEGTTKAETVAVFSPTVPSAGPQSKFTARLGGSTGTDTVPGLISRTNKGPGSYVRVPSKDDSCIGGKSRGDASGRVTVTGDGTRTLGATAVADVDCGDPNAVARHNAHLGCVEKATHAFRAGVYELMEGEALHPGLQVVALGGETISTIPLEIHWAMVSNACTGSRMEAVIGVLNRHRPSESGSGAASVSAYDEAAVRLLSSMFSHAYAVIDSAMTSVATITFAFLPLYIANTIGVWGIAPLIIVAHVLYIPLVGARVLAYAPLYCQHRDALADTLLDTDPALKVVVQVRRRALLLLGDSMLPCFPRSLRPV